MLARELQRLFELRVHADGARGNGCRAGNAARGRGRGVVGGTGVQRQDAQEVRDNSHSVRTLVTRCGPPEKAGTGTDWGTPCPRCASPMRERAGKTLNRLDIFLSGRWPRPRCKSHEIL